jgi:hypothetical protein
MKNVEQSDVFFINRLLYIFDSGRPLEELRIDLLYEAGRQDRQDLLRALAKALAPLECDCH